MSLIKYIAGSAAAIGLVIAAVTICSFDAANLDIARPPSLEKLVSPMPATNSASSPDGAGDSQSSMVTFITDPLDRYGVYQLARDFTGSPTPDQPRLLLLAAGRSLRDVEIQTAAINQLLKEKKYPQALERMDGLIRANPSLRSQLYDALALFVRSTESRHALVELLGLDPPWRKNFFTYLPASTIDTQTASTLIAEVRSTGSVPQSDELAPFIHKLIVDGAIDRAYSLWLNSLSEAQLARAGYIYNGDFEAKLAQEGPFDWIVLPTKNVVARAIRNTSAERGMVLEVAFADSQTAYGNLYQRLMLPAGTYVLTGSYKANNLENDRGFVWRISCETTAPQKLGESAAMKGTQDWTLFEISFGVPDKDCASQILRLQLNARAKLDLRVRGALSFDDLRIDRQE